MLLSLGTVLCRRLLAKSFLFYLRMSFNYLRLMLSLANKWATYLNLGQQSTTTGSRQTTTTGILHILFRLCCLESNSFEFSLLSEWKVYNYVLNLLRGTLMKCTLHSTD